MPITAHGSTMPTGPLVSVAILINSIAQMGIPFNPSSHHRYNWSMAKTMKQVSTISTRDAIAARCTSNPDSSNREARNAMSFLLRLAKKRKHTIAIRIAASAEGRREVNSVTSPTGRDNAAIHQ